MVNIPNTSLNIQSHYSLNVRKTSVYLRSTGPSIYLRRSSNFYSAPILKVFRIFTKDLSKFTVYKSLSIFTEVFSKYTEVFKNLKRLFLSFNK